MKRKLLYLVCVITSMFVTGCTEVVHVNENGKILNNKPGQLYVNNRVALDNMRVVDVSYNGETHEYIYGAYRIAHWEGCKYCKQNKNKIND